MEKLNFLTDQMKKHFVVCSLVSSAKEDGDAAATIAINVKGGSEEIP